MADHMPGAVGATLVAQAAIPSIMGWPTDDGVSVFEIAPCGDAAYGSPVALPGDHGASDRANSNPTLRNRKIFRLELLAGLRRTQPGRWGRGQLYDPESGVTNAVSAQVDASRVRLRIIVHEDGSAFDLKWKRVIAPDSASAGCPVAR